MECLTNYINELDELLLKGIQVDTMKSYGVVTRHYNDYNGKIVNIADNLNDIHEGEFAHWDDRFQTIWFHRINQIINTKVKQGYGREKYTYREKTYLSQVIWSKRKITWNGEYREVKQPELYRMFVNLLSHYSIAQVSSVDFDITQIETNEFMKGFTHKDCFLLRINYDLEYDVPKECIDCNINDDCK